VLNENGDFVGFDAVIGNPPYGVKATKEEKKYYKNAFQTILGKYESYGFFIEKGIKILKTKGMFSYIVPHTWLTVKEASQTRNLIFDTSKILEIDKLPENVFEDATVDTTIFFLLKEKIKKAYEAKCLIFDLKSKIQSLETDFKLSQIYNVNMWKEKDSINLRIGKKENKVLEVALVDTIPFSDVFDFSVGVQAYDSYAGQPKEIIKNRAYHSDQKLNETYLPELNGKDIERYLINPKKESWISYGKWLAHPRSEKYFFNPRVLIREITGKGRYKLYCSLIDEVSINYKSILNLIIPDNNIDKLFVALSLLNSSFMSWYFYLNSNKQDSNSFPRVSILDMKKFPIKIKAFEPKFIHSIKEKVQEIQSAKKLDPKADTSKLDFEIDQLVYELYNLSKEEIAIIEESTK